jgi:hypothetical protein
MFVYDSRELGRMGVVLGGSWSEEHLLSRGACTKCGGEGAWVPKRLPFKRAGLKCSIRDFMRSYHIFGYFKVLVVGQHLYSTNSWLVVG